MTRILPSFLRGTNIMELTSANVIEIHLAAAKLIAVTVPTLRALDFPLTCNGGLSRTP